MTRTAGAAKDIAKLVRDEKIRIVNLCHISQDSRLKTLSFAVQSAEQLHEILEFGERVDGSSLFSYIDADKSDIYIMPRTESSFVNPFSPAPALNILCDYLDERGNPLDIAPRNILLKAEEKLRHSAGIVLKALAELEFYIIRKSDNPPLTQGAIGNYHESAPFAEFENIRNEALLTLADIGLPTKYAHGEAGRFHTTTGYVMEQHEIELLPQTLGQTAEAVTIAKWVLRNVCARHGVSVSFSPKPALEQPGNGMHIHLCGMRNGENVIADSRGVLTAEGKQMIGGMLTLARSLTAFGNTTPVSYLRFITSKESPNHICWGARDRLALIRLPLWWSFKKGLRETGSCRRTLEFRAPDASANMYLLLAGIAVAVEHGLRNPEESLRIAEDHRIERVGREKKYELLSQSCSESARVLERQRSYYEADGVFPERVINGTIDKLASYKDENLWKELVDKPEKLSDYLFRFLFYG